MRLTRFHTRRLGLEALAVLCQLCSRSLCQPSRELQPIPLHIHRLTPLVFTVSTSLPDPPPEVGVHRKRSHLAGSGVKESAMVDEPAVTEKSRQHGQCTRRESLVDEGLLPFERLDGGTTGQGIFAGCGIGNLRIKLTDAAKTFRLLAVSAVERLAQHKLPARRIVPEIEPITTYP